MAAVKIATWVFVFLVGAIAVYLAWNNRGSEKVATNFPTALAVSAVGALLTLLFSLHAEDKRAEFPVEYVIDTQTRRPFQCEFFPECTQYTDAGALTVFPAWLVVWAIEEADPNLSVQTDDKGLGWLYRRVLLRQILEVFRFTFTKSWDAQPTRFELPTGGSETVYAAREIREGRKLTNEELIAAFGGDVTVGSERRGPLNLPPDTSVVAAHTAATSSLAFRNRFVHVEIIIADREIASGAGPFRELCRLPFSESDPTRRPRYLVSLSAKFAQFRAGHPDMPLYRHWVDIMIGEVQRFDSVARWQLMRDRYLLLYAHRTKTPAQEMIEYTLKKAEEKK